MPRAQMKILPHKQNDIVNCFAFIKGEDGFRPRCKALNEIYCLCEDEPCAFFATPQQAQNSRRKAGLRLYALGYPVKMSERNI